MLLLLRTHNSGKTKIFLVEGRELDELKIVVTPDRGQRAVVAPRPRLRLEVTLTPETPWTG